MLVVLSEKKKKTDETYCRTNTFPFNRSSYKIFMSFNKGVGRDDLIVSSQKKWNYQNMNPPWNMIKYRFNFSTSILILASDYLRSMKFLRISCSKYYIKCYVKETLQWYCLFQNRLNIKDFRRVKKNLFTPT